MTAKSKMPERIYVTPSSKAGDDFPATAFCLPGDIEYIRADIHDKRVSDLLEANNRYLKQARDAKIAMVILSGKADGLTPDEILKLIDGGE